MRAEYHKNVKISFSLPHVQRYKSDGFVVQVENVLFTNKPINQVTFNGCDSFGYHT